MVLAGDHQSQKNNGDEEGKNEAISIVLILYVKTIVRCEAEESACPLEKTNEGFSEKLLSEFAEVISS